MQRIFFTLVVIVFAVFSCGCTTYRMASFPADGGGECGPLNEVVVQETATVRIVLTNGSIEEGMVVSVCEDYLVLANEGGKKGVPREFQTIEIKSVEVRSSGISDKVAFVSIAGVSALIAIISISTFEEPDG